MSTHETEKSALSAPGTWRDPDSHFEVALTHPWYRMLLQMTDIMQRATVEFWAGRGVRAAFLPVTTGSISSPMGLGSDSLPVRVELEGVPTYLADSMQFLLEYGCRMWEQGCYYVMPSFRGEAPDSTHLCQFYHSEAELPGDMDSVMDTVEAYVRHLGQAYLEEMGPTIAEVAGDTAHIERLLALDAFPQVSFTQAVELLGDTPEYVGEVAEGARTLTRAGERALMDKFGEFVWLTHFDHLSVPFYQAYEPGDPSLARNGDLLFGVGETVGCGERHATADETRRALAEHQVPEEDYAWYLRMRELRPMQTSGFGLGVERFFLWLLKHDEIRDMQMLHRVNGRQINP
ncbi:asparagine synthetase A [Streptomyces sp. TP-A0874]|uniref:asparagine synthetase A n=1 Tax=Streptomyces sp. TP-A0874 TaxID=549819 RepID=UPI000B1F4530|nr:asparagine synthetase A [Streptomyces sp. TP-A0874]